MLQTILWVKTRQVDPFGTFFLAMLGSKRKMPPR